MTELTNQEHTYTYAGIVARVMFHAEDTGWTALKISHIHLDDSIPLPIRDEHDQDHNHNQDQDPTGLTISASGHFPSIHEGEELKVTGFWECHPKYGWQLKISHSIPLIPTTTDGIQRFLASSATYGIGPVTSKKLVKHFGVDTIKVLDEAINDDVGDGKGNLSALMRVPGIGAKKAAEIVKGWKEGGVVRDTMIALAGFGVGELTAIRLMRFYGTRLLDVLNKDPYVLADEVDGIGFKKADAIALGMGIGENDPRRLKGAVKYVLQQALAVGDCWLGRVDIEKEVGKLIDQDIISEIEELVKNGELIFEGGEEISLHGAYYLPSVYRAEKHVAEMVREKLGNMIEECKIVHIYDFEHSTLTLQQREAVKMALISPLSILTGGPGTGKTTTILEVVKMCQLAEDVEDAIEIELLLCAPTGRAAKRLAEVTNYDAVTIHRLLAYNPIIGGFSRNENNPLDGDLLVIDEVSMVDIFLMESLLSAVPERMRVVMVGDINQLPSVGPGNVLRDLLNTDTKIPSVNLAQIHRQAADSQIIANAHRINSGTTTLKSGADFRIVPTNDPASTLDMIREIVTTKFSGEIDKRKDIQVLASHYKGECGVNKLNEMLQNLVNPETSVKKGKGVYSFGQTFRIDDRVMHIRNNYKLGDSGVFNGEIGFVSRVGLDGDDSNNVYVTYPGSVSDVCYEPADLIELRLAYACTIHKSQGCEFPVVIIAASTDTPYPLRQRNLLYTAVTRAKKLCVIVGEQQIVWQMIKNDKIKTRNTLLTERVQGVM